MIIRKERAVRRFTATIKWTHTDGGIEAMGEETAAVDPPDDALTMIVVGIVSIVTFLAGFGLLAIGFDYFWIAFVVGFAGVMPLALGLLSYYRARGGATESRGVDEPDDALAQLRNRYARGELSEPEFERRVEGLLETEGLDVPERSSGRSDETAEGTVPADGDEVREID